MDNPDGPNVITGFFNVGEAGGRVRTRERFEDAVPLTQRRRKGTQAKGCQWLLEAGIGKAMILPWTVRKEQGPAHTLMLAQ